MQSTVKYKTASQIQLKDSDEPAAYKSLYLETLSAEERATTAWQRLHTTQPLPSKSSRRGGAAAAAAEGSWRPAEAYIHGALTTEGISGASPAVARQRSPEPGQVSPGLVKEWLGERGMSPKRLHPVNVNKQQDMILKTDDIRGAKPRPPGIITHRLTNPLEPHYTLPSSPPAQPLPDKFLGDPLDISDIDGAARKPKNQRSSTCSRLLEVDDIAGARAGWKPHHRQHFGVHLRDHQLNVRDITGSSSSGSGCGSGGRREIVGQDFASKGHPEGPRCPSRVRSRCNKSEQDNSLRTMNVEGVRLAVLRDNDPFVTKFARRHSKHTVVSCADIEGASPRNHDKVQFFGRRRDAGAQLSAVHTEGEQALQQLLVDRPAVEQLWSVCKAKDREGSGLITGPELTAAMAAAKVGASPEEVSKIARGLQDNAGLIDYRSIAKQLLSRCTAAKGRSASTAGASSSSSSPSTSAAGALRSSRPSCSQPGAGSSSDAAPSQASSPAPLAAAAAAGIDTVPCSDVSQSASHPTGKIVNSSSIRPNSAPTAAAAAAAVACSSGNLNVSAVEVASSNQADGSGCQDVVHGSLAAGSGPQQGQQQQQWHQKPRLTRPVTTALLVSQGTCKPATEEFKRVSHWFGGSLRDGQAQQVLEHWKPSHDASSSSNGAGSSSSSSLRRPGSHVPSSQHGSCEGAGGSASGTGRMVPSWVMGTDDPHLAAAVMQSADFGSHGVSFKLSGSTRAAASRSSGRCSSSGGCRPQHGSAAAHSNLRCQSALGTSTSSGSSGSGRLQAAGAGGGKVGGSCHQPATASARMVTSRNSAAGMKDSLLGLAERRREVETRRSELEAIRGLA